MSDDERAPRKARIYHVNRKNLPVHIVFWAFVAFLLYLFYRAFSG